MKKMAILFGLSISLSTLLFAQRYPIVMEYSYLSGCINSSDKVNMKDYCICTLKAIENKYSLDEFLNLIEDKNKKQEVIKYAVDQCLDKLKK